MSGNPRPVGRARPGPATGSYQVIHRGGPELRRSGVCKSGSPSERRSSSSVVPARSPDRLSRSATATRMSVFWVIRSPAPPRFLFNTRARIDRLVIWSGQIRSSFRSSRRYFGSSGTPARARPCEAAGCPCGRRCLPGGLTASLLCTSVLCTSVLCTSVLCTSVVCTSVVCCTGVCASAGGTAGRAGSGGTTAGVGCSPASEPRLAGLTPVSARRAARAQSGARPGRGGCRPPRGATSGRRGMP
jgi:hypothetical protein